MSNSSQRGPTGRDPLSSAVQELERALSMTSATRESDWVARMDRTLVAVKRAVAQRDTDLKTRGTLLVDVASDSASSPTAARLADELRHELDGVLEEVESLRSRAAGVAPDHGAFRNRVARLLDALRSFSCQESGMILEAVNRDVGGGD